jgi:hypothetical protein
MDLDHQAIELGRLAWQRIKGSASFDDWVQIGRALCVGRKLSMTEAKVDKPQGGRYTNAYGNWLKANGFTEINPGARNHAILVAENIGAINEWLADMNHPSVVWLAYCAATTNAARSYGCGARAEDFNRCHSCREERGARVGKDNGRKNRLAVNRASGRSRGLRCPELT